MYKLFEGLDCAHGTYVAEDRGANGVKMEIKRTAKTLRSGPSVQLWEAHLAGKKPLGVVPIRADNTCVWGAIDIDKYDIDHGELVKKLDSAGVPAIVAKTKSGGAHIYMFFSDPVQAGTVLSKLRELAAYLGYGDSEIFPKQDTLLLDRGDLGNWLNMPYYHGDEGPRYAVKEDGRGMTLSEFLRLAVKKRISSRDFNLLSFTTHLPDFADGPPCLEVLCSRGIGEGARNNGLFALGVLAKKISADNWDILLEKWNRQYFTPPLTSEEVINVTRSLKKKEYSYKCGDAPIVSVCNMALCRTRKYGVGTNSGMSFVESISILDTEPPLFFVTLKTGGTVECDTNALLNSREFQKQALNQLRVVTPLVKNDDWLNQIQSCIENAITIEAPREVSVTGQFEEYVERFCTDRHAADIKDDILLGKPWVSEEKRRVYFRLRDLQELLDRYKFNSLSRGQITTRIKQMGGDTEFHHIRNKGVNLWWIPMDKFQWISSPLDIPIIDEIPL